MTLARIIFVLLLCFVYSWGQTHFGLSCGSSTGLSGPLPLCSPSFPCSNPLVTYATGNVTKSTDVPTCGFASRLKTITDLRNQTRYYCLFLPSSGFSGPLPLIVFLHGAGGNADDILASTNLDTSYQSYQLSQNGGSGFNIIAVQGTNLHWPTPDPRDGPHHDTFFRDFASPSTNPDYWLYDTLIDQYVADGTVDKSQIYMVGWSNGGYMAQSYGINRYTTATPGGNNVAAVVAYTAADPFNNVAKTQNPSCTLIPYPTSNIPILLITRDCDLICCDANQCANLTTQGAVPTPGSDVTTWVTTSLATEVQNSKHTWILLDSSGNNVTSCASSCSLVTAALNHIDWPQELEPNMLSFLGRESNGVSGATTTAGATNDGYRLIPGYLSDLVDMLSFESSSV